MKPDPPEVMKIYTIKTDAERRLVVLKVAEYLNSLSDAEFENQRHLTEIANMDPDIANAIRAGAMIRRARARFKDMDVRFVIGAGASIPDRKAIQKPPGHLLVTVGKFLLSKATYQRYIEPHILDIRLEYFEAIQAGEERKAKWIVIRGYYQVLKPFVAAIWSRIAALLRVST